MCTKKTLILMVLLFAVVVTTVYSQANTTLSNLASPTSINRTLTPSGNNSLNLGSGTNSWRFLYIDSQIYIKDFVAIHSRGTGNFFAGQNAGNLSLTGTYNTAFGQSSLRALTTGQSNVALGFSAMYQNTSGINNVATGVKALNSNMDGRYNVATGYRALYSNISGWYNTATGTEALYNNDGVDNTALGYQSLQFNKTGYDNTAVGLWAGRYITGSVNTAVGVLAGTTNSVTSTFIGAFATGSDGISNSTALGYDAYVSAPNTIVIGNTTITSIKGQVGFTTFSDGRFKKNVREDVPGLTFIMQLKPVTYNLDANGIDRKLHADEKMNTPATEKYNNIYSEDKVALEAKSKIVYTGFVAQDVESVAKKLNYDFSGVDAPKNKDDVYGLRYAEFVVPLVKAVQEQQIQMKQQQDRIEQQAQQIIELKEMIKKLASGQTISIKSELGYLEQSTPNPAQANILLRFYVPENTISAKIAITGINGQTIKTIPINNKGTGKINFNAAALAMGTYSYSLYINDKLTDTKQFIKQ